MEYPDDGVGAEGIGRIEREIQRGICDLETGFLAHRPDNLRVRVSLEHHAPVGPCDSEVHGDLCVAGLVRQNASHYEPNVRGITVAKLFDQRYSWRTRAEPVFEVIRGSTNRDVASETPRLVRVHRTGHGQANEEKCR